MGQNCPLSDEDLGRLSERQYKLYRRVRKGKLSYKQAMSGLRDIMHGRRPRRARKPLPLVHGLFLPASYQLRLVREFNRTDGWGFTDEDFAYAESSIPDWPDETLTALVLVAYRESVQHTFDMWWTATERRYRRSWRWERTAAWPEVMKTLDRRPDVSCRLRWEVIDLGADQGKQPWTVSRTAHSPHVGVLAAAALHRRWVWSMNGGNVPYVWIGGLKLYWPNDPEAPLLTAWCCPPRIFYDAVGRRVCLSSRWNGGDFGTYAVPRFVRTPDNLEA